MRSVAHPSDYFMQLARRAALNSNCIRRSVGAVIVVDNEVVASGWNGVEGRSGSCREAGCPRCIEGGLTGSGYERCICIHAEQKAIAAAAAAGSSTEGAALYVNLRPCLQCLGIMKAAGIKAVYFDEDWTYSDDLERLYRAMSRQFEYYGHYKRALIDA